MTDLHCPDDTVEHPRVPANSPGLPVIDYRVGDFEAFRRALLRRQPDELALAGWEPGVSGDLGVQLLEWWAYLADVLAFYNERALTGALLRTAPTEDVRRIVRLLGYRPRPGIGATGVLAALTDSSRPFVLPRGLPVQGPGRGGSPHVYELDDDIEIGVVGRPPPPSAGFATLSVEEVPPAAPEPVYFPRLPGGRLLDWLPAHDAAPSAFPPLEAGKEIVVAVDGIVTNVAPDDVVVIMPAEWDGVAATALALVHELGPRRDDAGRPITELRLWPGQDFPGGMPPAECKIMKPTKSAHLWLYHERYPGPKLPTDASIVQGIEQVLDPLGLFTEGVSSEPPQDAHVLTSKVLLPPSDEGAAHLEGIVRGINPGDPVLFEQVAGDQPDGADAGSIVDMIGALFTTMAPGLAGVLGAQRRTLFTKVTGYTELIWYANPPDPARIGQGPPIGPPGGGAISGGAAPIPIPHSRLSFRDPDLVATAMSLEDMRIKTVVVHFAWEEVGEPISHDIAKPITDAAIAAPPEIPPGTPAVLEDDTGAGAPGWVGRISSDLPPLVGPVRALLNLLPVSRGESVSGEVLGRGDPTSSWQELPLGRGPLTYLTDTARGPFDGYRSTLRIRVGGIEWREVASFHDQPADARVFVTREDDQQRTSVRFGDGVHGARLPAGVEVVADYRVGSGAEVPPIGTLTTILRPQPGLSSVRNPIAPGGGADPDPPEQIRRYVPRSVLTFGRAVSGDDYETVAAQTPGVQRAKAVWRWDSGGQRTVVEVLVGDDEAAVAAARDALRAVGDPNRPVLVSLAAPVFVDLRLTVEVHPDHDPTVVASAVRAALLDAGHAPFGADVVRIGDAVYDSEIDDCCLDVAGVVAVHGLRFGVPVAPPVHGVRRRAKLPPGFADRFASSPAPGSPATLRLETGPRHVPGASRFYLLRSDSLHIATEVSRHAH